MRPIPWRALPPALALAGVLLAGEARAQVLARVGESTITRSQVERFADAVRERGSEPPGAERALAHLVERRLLALAARERYPEERAGIEADLERIAEAVLREAFLEARLAPARRPASEEEVDAAYVEVRLHEIDVYRFRDRARAEDLVGGAPASVQERPNDSFADASANDARLEEPLVKALAGAAVGSWLGPFEHRGMFLVGRLRGARGRTAEERERERERLRREIPGRRFRTEVDALWAGLRARFGYSEDEPLLQRLVVAGDDGGAEGTTVLAAIQARVFTVADYRAASAAAARRSHDAMTAKKRRNVFAGMVNDALIREAVRADGFAERPEARERIEIEADRLWAELASRRASVEAPEGRALEQLSGMIAEARARFPVTIVPAAP